MDGANSQIERDMLRIIKPQLFEAREDLDDFVFVLIQAVRGTKECTDRMDIQVFKNEVWKLLHENFHELYHWCESKYDNWNFKNQIDWTYVEKVQFRYMVTACTETAKRLTQKNILDLAVVCLDVSAIRKLKQPLLRRGN